MSEQAVHAGEGGLDVHDLELPGCTPEPLMSYLKALGLLRLVSEQASGRAGQLVMQPTRGWWHNDVFWLRSTALVGGAGTDEAKREAMVRFLLEQYSPTAIVAPWAGGSGFFAKDNKAAINALRASTNQRVESYARVIQIVEGIIAEEKVGDKPKDEDKARLIRRYRRELPDEVVAWMDAAMVLVEDGQSFAPLLGTGGNDGRLDFTQNFMQRLVVLGLHENAPASAESREWLEHALFTIPAVLQKASVGQFAPGRAGGANATQGMEGDSTDNPWNFVLMLEGALLLAGAAVKRLNVSDRGRAVFPFTVRAVGSGFDSPSAKDEAESRGELWLPLWEEPATIGELRHLFGEGRADVSSRRARDGTDFARAVATLGVDRGISAFTRLGFLRRSGKAYLATPLGRFQVQERVRAELLREIDPWLDRFRSAAGDAKAPPRFARALRAIDSAIFDYCRYGGTPLLQKILVALGRAERELAVTPGKLGISKRPPGPLAGLSNAWIQAADDMTVEFAIARAVAGVHDPERKIGPLRTNLEPVDWQTGCRVWSERDRCVVWNSENLSANLTGVLTRRMMDGQRLGCNNLPLASAASASLATIASFLSGQTNDRRIEDLLWGLMLARPGKHDAPQSDDGAVPLPAAYCLLKLTFPAHRLLIGFQDDGRLFARYGADVGVRVRPEPRIPHILRAGHLGEACTIAARRLRASGLAPMPCARAGRTRDSAWNELDRMGRTAIDPLRVAAALLIPVSEGAIARLVTRISRQEQIEAAPEPASIAGA